MFRSFSVPSHGNFAFEEKSGAQGEPTPQMGFVFSLRGKTPYENQQDEISHPIHFPQHRPHQELLWAHHCR